MISAHLGLDTAVHTMSKSPFSSLLANCRARQSWEAICITFVTQHKATSGECRDHNITLQRLSVSRIDCRIKFPQNQRCCAKIALHPPPPNQGVASFSGPPVALSSHSQQRGQGGLVESVAGRAPKYRTKGVRAIDARNSWLENGSNAAKPVFALRAVNGRA